MFFAPRLVVAGLALGLSGLLVAPVQGITYIWTGDGANDNWNTAGNWQDDTAPPSPLGAGDSILVQGTEGSPFTINMNVDQRWNANTTLSFSHVDLAGTSASLFRPQAADLQVDFSVDNSTMSTGWGFFHSNMQTASGSLTVTDSTWSINTGGGAGLRVGLGTGQMQVTLTNSTMTNLVAGQNTGNPESQYAILGPNTVFSAENSTLVQHVRDGTGQTAFVNQITNPVNFQAAGLTLSLGAERITGNNEVFMEVAGQDFGNIVDPGDWAAASQNFFIGKLILDMNDDPATFFHLVDDHDNATGTDAQYVGILELLSDVQIVTNGLNLYYQELVNPNGFTMTIVDPESGGSVQQFTIIPEPATLMLLGLGAALMASRSRRR